MRSITRKLTNEPQMADRCRLQAGTEVVCEFIADYVVPQMIIRSPRVRPGKFVLVDAKRLLQQYRHSTDMAPQSLHVCYRGVNGPSTRNQSLVIRRPLK